MNKMFERKIQLKNKEINLKIIILFMYLRKILIWNELISPLNRLCLLNINIINVLIKTIFLYKNKKPKLIGKRCHPKASTAIPINLYH